MTTRWEGLIPLLGPRWLTRDEVDGVETVNRVLFALGLVLEARIERVKQGVRARFPGLGPSDALVYSGRDAHLARGPNESDESFAGRCVRALDDWKVAGSAWSILEQIRGYLSPHAVRVRLYNEHGNCYTIDADGTREAIVRHSSWNWDGAAGLWSRLYVVIYPPATLWTAGPAIGDADLWGGAVGTAGYTIGSTATPGDVQGLQRVVKTFKSSGARCVTIIVAFDDTLFDPTAPEPDGTWGRASVVPGYAPAREALGRYWVGTSLGTGL